MGENRRRNQERNERKRKNEKRIRMEGGVGELKEG
jgi:hypothetical protein